MKNHYKKSVITLLTLILCFCATIAIAGKSQTPLSHKRIAFKIVREHERKIYFFSGDIDGELMIELDPAQSESLLGYKIPNDFNEKKARLIKESPKSATLDFGIYLPFWTFQPPPYDFYVKQRPQMEDNGYFSDNTKLEMKPGPLWPENGYIWFGVDFCDGDGISGVGAVGFYDSVMNQYELRYPNELADWSASAIYKDGKTVWLGLVSPLKSERRSGGLAKYDVAEGTLVIYQVPDIINDIQVYKGCVYMGSDNGVYVLSNEKILHLSVSPGLNGDYLLNLNDM